MEDYYVHTKLSGEPPGAAWDAANWDEDNCEFTDERPSVVCSTTVADRGDLHTLITGRQEGTSTSLTGFSRQAPWATRLVAGAPLCRTSTHRRTID
jgi:hypothetical protein